MNFWKDLGEMFMLYPFKMPAFLIITNVMAYAMFQWINNF